MDAQNQRNVAKVKVANDGMAMSHTKDGIVDHFMRITAKDMVFCILILVFIMLSATVLGGLLSYVLNRLAALSAMRLAIDSYDGLPRNESNMALSPEFNLRMYGVKGLKLNGFNKTLCYSRGYIKIEYQGFSLASGDIAGSCLNATNGHTIALFAQGKHVEMPLLLQKRLRDEVNNGMAVLNTNVVLLVACDAAFPYCGRCSFSCQPLIGHKEFSICHLTDVQKDSNSLE